MQDNNYSNSPSAKKKSGNTDSLKSDGGKSKSNSIEIPSISLPKGGGALKGIDEKFQVNAANGTSVFNLPLPFSKSRSSFGPSLTLSYNSGSGNSVFGLGWSCDVPNIQRKTDKKLPQYRDKEESDTFLFAGAEDLVPFLKKERDDWIADEHISSNGESIKAYRQRIEGLFAKIERIGNGTALYWKVTTKENVVSFFGRSSASRIADPLDETKIFKWLPDLSYDDKGNCMEFEYVNEDLINVPLQVNERNRLNLIAPFANKYLKRIKYGNKKPFYADSNSPYTPASPSDPGYFFETVFDYDDHDNAVPSTAVQQNWSSRTDPYSDHKAGFEIRSWRLCSRILFFHNFVELGIEPTLVRSINFNYKYFKNSPEENSEADYIIAIEQFGYKGNANDGYENRSLPKLEFTYNELSWNTEVKNVSEENMIHAPVGIGNNYQWADFFGEGISGILTEQADAWYYKSNLGDGDFSIAQPVMTKPNLNGLSSGLLQLQDVDADGRKFIVSTDKALNGYYEQTDKGDWYPFKPFENHVNIDFQNDNIKFLDLNGDGIPELVLSEESVFTWYASKGTKGYDAAVHSVKPFDEELGPALVFSDMQQRIYLVDMSGDGLTDIVRIKNGEVCYWSNLGYGNFSAKVTMHNAPVFDSAEDFNPAYLHLFDVSGTGVTDLVYLGKNSFKAFFNLSGNAWSEANEIENFPSVELPNTVNVVDFLGNGTGCIVWSSPLPGNSITNMRYIDLMGGKKPYIIASYKNNFGKQTTVEYKSSTQFYLEDKLNGTPWITKLPFPVQCVSKLEITDEVTGVRFTNQYSYHHGYYDHAEREFRGFGRVEQIDSEYYDEFSSSCATNNPGEILFQSPVLTKTWYHTGAFLDREKILDQFSGEYFVNEYFSEYHLPQPALADEWLVQEWREALRACKGMVLRQEVYALDETEKEKSPYSVAEHNCSIQLLQPVEENRYAVFLVTESEAIIYNYERNPADPRIAHTLNIEIDTYGNILESSAVVYGRIEAAEPDLPVDLEKDRDLIKKEQQKIHIIYSKNNFTNSIKEDHAYRLPLAYENISYELTGASSITTYFSPGEIKDAFAGATEIAYESASDGSLQYRKIEHTRILFLDDDANTILPLGKLSSLGLGYESYQLAFTSSLIDEVFGELDVSGVLSNAKYHHFDDENEYWIRSGTAIFMADPVSHFFLPDKYIDPLGSETKISFYSDYHLLIEKTEDAIGNVVNIDSFDFRFPAPKKMTDITGSVSEVAFDMLGLVAGIAVSGKNGEGDKLDELFFTDLSNEDINNFFLNPQSNAASLLGNATARLVYDLSRANVSTAAVASIVREKHLHQLEGGESSKQQISFEYTDGFGNIAMKKVQAEPGKAKSCKNKIVEEVDADPRWLGNGRTILNNKGKPVKQFEPYFSNTHGYENESALVEVGVTPIMYYDPLGRLIKTEFPDGTFSKAEFDGWFQKVYDGNDTVLDSAWYSEKSAESDAEKDAAAKASVHYNTPSTVHLDSLGRSFYSIAHNAFVDSAGNRIEEFNSNYTELDIENNARKLVDARGNAVMQYKYDMLGNVLYQNSMDAGERWILNNVMNMPLWSRDSNETVTEFAYDELHRSTGVDVTEKGKSSIKPMRIVYGEGVGDYFEGKPYLTYDGTGVVTNNAYDFKGNLLSSSRQLLINYKDEVNWNLDNELEADIFTATSEYDALNRIITSIAPDNSVFIPAYNEANLLEKVSVKLKGATEETTFVSDINYNEKGQRTYIGYGNGTETTYEYDEKTFRVSHVKTTKNSMGILQDLYYTYDPIGNITQIKDDAQPVTFYDNEMIEPVNSYTYDAIYQLVAATGKEHKGQMQFGTTDNYNDFPFLTQYGAADSLAVRNYTQKYAYDEVGNIMQMKHIATDGSWTRDYEYEALNNRLKKTKIGSDTYTYFYNVHGSITTMPHLAVIDWNLKEEMKHTDLGGGGNAYYVYDATGIRTRKVIERIDGTKEERIYFGTYEIYRTYDYSNSISLERETLHILDGKQRIAMIDTRTMGTDEYEEQLTRYQYNNHLGTATLELNESGSIISYEECHPYGTTAFQAMNKEIKATGKRYRYTGKERDDETGFNYHGARYYVLWLARWIAADPIGVKDGWNIYCYALNNPIIKVDLTGKGSSKPDWLVKIQEGNEWENVTNEMLDQAVKEGHIKGYATEVRLSTPKTGTFTSADKLVFLDNGLVISETKLSGVTELTDRQLEAVTEVANTGKVSMDSDSHTFRHLNDSGEVVTGTLKKQVLNVDAYAVWRKSGSTIDKMVVQGMDLAGIQNATGASKSRILKFMEGVNVKKTVTIAGGMMVLLKPAAAVAGPLGDVVDVTLSAKTVYDAPSEQRGQVLKEEGLGLAGGAAGAGAGTAATGLVVGAGLCSTGWGCFAVGAVLVGGGGLAGDQLGRSAAEFDLQKTTTDFLNDMEKLLKYYTDPTPYYYHMGGF